MTGAQYPVDTLTQMAAIPVEARSRFLAELPVMLAEIARMQEIVGVVNAAVEGGVFESPSFEGAVWVDDDKSTIDQMIDIAGFDPIHVRKTFATGSDA